MIITNLLKETELVLANHGMTWNAVKFIRNSTGLIEFAQFAKEAATITYDADYGPVVIDPSLKIVGSKWWLERMNDRGREGWVFRDKPDRPTLMAKDYRLRADHLSEIPDWTQQIEIYRTEKK